MPKNKDEVQAVLRVLNMKDTTPAKRKRIADWLRQAAKDIQKAKPEEYTKNPKWTLYN